MRKIAIERPHTFSDIDLNDVMTNKIHEFDTPSDLLKAVEGLIAETDVVADIGCGIVPMSYFRPKLHLLVEPWVEYADILSYRHADDKSVLIIRLGALEALRAFADNSVDSIFLLDVIEHIEKNDGFEILKECERVARIQVVVFTPLGFMPQHLEAGEHDAWGLSGTGVQEHRSGWLPSDFSDDWMICVCNMFHTTDFRGELLPKAHGAFYAIRNFEGKKIDRPPLLSDIRRPLPSEVALQALQAEFDRLSSESRARVIDLEQREKWVAEKDSQLANHEQNLRNMEADLGRRESWLAEKEPQLAAHEQNLSALETDLVRREGWLTEKEPQLAVHEQNLRSLEAEIARREAWLVEKEAQLATHEQNLRSLEAEIARREAWLVEKEAQLATHEQNLRSLEPEIARREAWLVEKEAQFATHEQNLRTLEAELSRQTSVFRAEVDRFNSSRLVRAYRRLNNLVRS